MYQNILLIDDDEDDQEIFTTVLRELGYTSHCIIAKNGREAIDFLSSKKVTPDLIFLDLNMPLMDGRQFLKTYHTIENNRTPVVVLTTSSDNRTRIELLEMGASQFITKPHSFEEMKTVLQRIFLQ